MRKLRSQSLSSDAPPARQERERREPGNDVGDEKACYTNLVVVGGEERALSLHCLVCRVLEVTSVVVKEIS